MTYNNFLREMIDILTQETNNAGLGKLRENEHFLQCRNVDYFTNNSRQCDKVRIGVYLKNINDGSGLELKEYFGARIPKRDRQEFGNISVSFSQETNRDFEYLANLDGASVVIKVGKGRNQNGTSRKAFEVELPISWSDKECFTADERKLIIDSYKTFIINLIPNEQEVRERLFGGRCGIRGGNADRKGGVSALPRKQKYENQTALKKIFLRHGLKQNEKSVFKYSELLSGHIIEGAKVVALRGKARSGQLRLGRSRKFLTYFDLDNDELAEEIARIGKIRSNVCKECQQYARVEGKEVLDQLEEAIKLLVKISVGNEPIEDAERKELDLKIAQYLKTRSIVRSFRHTHDKDYENYVVTGIWHRLRKANLDLMPVTQQYVKRDDSHYALLDLYFPAIDFVVECDEAYHLHNYENDREREKDVYKSFAEWKADRRHSFDEIDDEQAIDAGRVETSNLRIARVDASVAYPSIDEQLDAIVEEIKKRFTEYDNPKWDIRSAEEILSDSEKVSTSDNLTFENISSVFEGMGIRHRNDGDRMLGWWQGGWPQKPTECVIIWFPHLGVKEGGRWNNILKDEGRTIIEKRGDDSLGPKAKRDWVQCRYALKNNNKRSIRIVFAHSKNALGESGYRFLGVFKLAECGEDATDGVPKSLTWTKVADEVIIDDWSKIVDSVRHFQ